MNMNEINNVYKNYKYVLLTNKNNHSKGFTKKIICSNLKPNLCYSKNSTGICFISYDYKNKLEQFSEKTNNPLQFPELVFIEAEHTIDVNDFVFPENETTILSSNINIKATVSKEEYIKKVNLLKQHIQQGDIYEINYCITFEAFDAVIDPIQVYQKLNSISKASYSALAKINHQYIICSSPELYLSKKGNTLISKPIKGTAKRGESVEQDIAIKNQLQHSLKERTENVMIVDVVRNDFSKIAQKGTVKVEHLFNIESYEQVHQMVSTVSCEVKEDKGFLDIINATFPMASMTGAPKYKAMQLIDDYELYNRGPYSGALGYIDAKGNFDLNVLIRSVFYDEQKRYLSFSVGSAITALCNPEEEYEECLLKAKALFSVI